MNDIPMKDISRLLREAEKAYNSGDGTTFGEITKQIPAGYTLVILKSCEHGPCFTIMSIESVPSLTSRFRVVTIDEPVVQSLPVAGQETNSEPDGSSSHVRVLGSMELGSEDDRGNL